MFQLITPSMKTKYTKNKKLKVQEIKSFLHLTKKEEREENITLIIALMVLVYVMLGILYL
jgi:glycosylphosphatidylinositol transamidase (GPIT) subunit GPI8